MSQIFKSAVGAPGVGNVVGPASSMDGDVVLFNGVTGKIIKDSTINATGIFTLTTSGIATGGGLVALGGTVNVNVPAGGFPWTDVSGAFVSTAGNGYFITGAASTTLPAAVQADSIEFILDTAASLVLTANAGQKIRIGSNISTVAGTATSTAIGCTVELIFRAADQIWLSGDNNGSWVLA